MATSSGLNSLSKRKVKKVSSATTSTIQLDFPTAYMNSKKPRKQLKLDKCYEELCFKYGIKYHPPAFNETKIERQERLQSLRCQVYSACDNVKAMNFKRTTRKTNNTSRTFEIPSQSIVLNDTDSGIAKSYTIDDEMDIDFACESDTLPPKITNVTDANASVSIDSQVNVVSQLQTLTESNFTANNISKCIRQPILTNFDILSLDNIDMRYKVKCDEAGIKFEPPNLNETKQDRYRRSDRMRKRINKALKSYTIDDEMDIDFACVTATHFDIQSLDKIDMRYKVKCDEAGVNFQPPSLNETKEDRSARFDRIRKLIVDKKYKVQCDEAGVLFEPLQSSESKQDRDSSWIG